MTVIASRTPNEPGVLQPAISTRAILGILAVTVGWGGVRSATRLLREGGGRLSGFDVTLANTQLVSLLAFELAVGISVAMYLRHRGWRLEQITLPPAWRDPLRALGLWLAALLSAWVIIILALLALVFLGTPTNALPLQPIRFVGHIDWVLAAAASIINPIFEEFLWLGFVAAAFRTAGAWRIGVLSVVLRVLVHTYQGAFSVLFIAPLGVLFVIYYLRTRRLWPVILAHGIQDLIGLSWLAATGGGR